MMMMMMMNCFCGMVDRRKAFSLISSRGHCQRSSPSRISDRPRAGFELAQNLSSGLVEWSCTVVTTTTPRRHNLSPYPNHKQFKYWEEDTLTPCFSNTILVSNSVGRGVEIFLLYIISKKEQQKIIFSIIEL